MSKARIAVAFIGLLGAILAVAGCGTAKTSTSDTGFSQLSINEDSSSLKTAMNLEFQALQSPASMAQTLVQTFAFTTGRDPNSLPEIARTDCGTQTGSATDSDHDGIPQSVSYSYSNCPVSAGAFSGTLSLRDNDNANASGGFTATASGLTYLGSGGVKINAARTLNLTASAGIYAVHSGMTLVRNDGLNVFNLSSQYSGMYAPDLVATPWLAGTIQLSGTITLARSTTSDEILTVTITGAHISSSCVVGPDAGTITYVDSKKNVLRTVYTACGLSRTTYNGFQAGN